MSTVAEAYWASANGVKVESASHVSPTMQPDSRPINSGHHEDVTIAATLVENKFNRLVRRIVDYF